MSMSVSASIEQEHSALRIRPEENVEMRGNKRDKTAVVRIKGNGVGMLSGNLLDGVGHVNTD